MSRHADIVSGGDTFASTNRIGWKERLTQWAFYAPIVFMLLFFALPMALTVVFSVFERTMFWMEPGFTLFAYENFFTSARLWNFLASMYHSLISVIICLVFGFPISVFVRRRIPQVAQHRVVLLFILPFMVSEIIRWQTPLAYMRRVAKQDVELGGQTIKKGDRVVMWYASGNRDERKFEDPDHFIIDRKDARNHMSFGYGVHRCMGNRLAELQLRILWEEILKRFDKIEVVGEPERVQSNFVRGYSELMVQLTPKS